MSYELLKILTEPLIACCCNVGKFEPAFEHKLHPDVLSQCMHVASTLAIATVNTAESTACNLQSACIEDKHIYKRLLGSMCTYIHMHETRYVKYCQ